MKKIIWIAQWILLSLPLGAQNLGEGAKKLREGWEMQSALRAGAGGAQISQSGFGTSGWLTVQLPTTIIAGLLQNKQYDFDPFYSHNLERIAGPEFDSAWWFRNEFSLPASARGKHIHLILHGINYRANVWVNGSLIADDKRVIGPFRVFELDLTQAIGFDKPNALAIEIRRPVDPNKKEGDLAIDYADWIHYPADFNGGIVNDVELSVCNEVEIRHPLVTTKFDLPSLDLAHLQVNAEAINLSGKEQEVTVEGKINDEIHFQKKWKLAPGETRDIVFSPEEFPQLNLRDPRIWWPWQYGKPQLNMIELAIQQNGKIQSRIKEHFGIRQINSELIDNKSREFIINGRPILLRGAAWSPDIFQRRSPQRQEQEIRLVRDMNMNIIRSEGKLEDDHFYDLCDQYGMLVMTGWMCCGAWQYPDQWDSVKRKVAMESDRTVMYWLRNKACLLVWLNGSDMPPRDSSVERNYLRIENELHWPNPVISTADASVSAVSGYSGVKMNGPYDWVPPIYWETDSNRFGGAWSFATEISPGPSIPPYESLIRFIPEDSLAVNSRDWMYHCGTMQFSTTNIFNQALARRYGPSSNIKDYVAKAQVQDYEGHRAMMEAYGLNKYHRATGVVQWMLSNPWPSLIWHTYDYFLYPAGTYFGIKKALEPLHVQYSYKSREVVVNNSLLRSFPDLTVKADLFNPDGALKYTYSLNTSIGEDEIKRCFVVPETEGLDSLYFLRLTLLDQGKTSSTNWYWLSRKNDSLDWIHSKWFYTPQSAFTDFSDLQNLNRTSLNISEIGIRGEAGSVHTIQLTNTGKAVAFFVHLRLLKKKGGGDILPVIFDDNYLLLAPGETRVIHASYFNQDAQDSSPFILCSAWNLDIPNSKAGNHTGFTLEMGGTDNRN
jgi:exo-1,4-beta-D-glucosaminidase